MGGLYHGTKDQTKLNGLGAKGSMQVSEAAGTWDLLCGGNWVSVSSLKEKQAHISATMLVLELQMCFLHSQLTPMSAPGHRVSPI